METKVFLGARDGGKSIAKDIARAKAYLDSTREEFRKNVEAAKKHIVEEGGALCGPVASKEPWLVPGVPWASEAAFWGWVRGVLRKGWSRHPVKTEYIKNNRKKIKNPKPSKRFPEVWGMTCAICEKDTVQSEIEIDHISDTGGTFRGLEDVRNYVAYLYLIDFDSLRCLCKTCHKIVNYAQAEGLSFDEAKAVKEALEFLKKDKKIVIDYLAKMNYNGSSVSNADKRRELVIELFKKGERP